MRLQGKLTPILSLSGKVSKTAEVIGSNIQPISIYENGTYYTPNGVDGFNPIYVDTPEPKEEQEKIVEITENGTTEVLPDVGSVLSKVTVNVDVAGAEEDLLAYTTQGAFFKEAHNFPSKAVVNLPNATNLYQAFSYWNTEPIPIVEELIVNAPLLADSSSYPNGVIGQMFTLNRGVKKVVLNLSDGLQKMSSLFSSAKALEEAVLNFSTKNVTLFGTTFNSSTVKRIIGSLDFSSATSVYNMFYACDNLEEVTFEPNTLSISISLAQSSKLTSESIQSIIDGLATVTTAQTLTLNRSAFENDFDRLTEAQRDVITNEKGWTLAFA